MPSNARARSQGRLFLSKQVKRVADVELSLLAVLLLKMATDAPSRRRIVSGACVWATGLAPRSFTKRLIDKLPEAQINRNGLVVDEKLKVLYVT